MREATYSSRRGPEKARSNACVISRNNLLFAAGGFVAHANSYYQRVAPPAAHSEDPGDGDRSGKLAMLPCSRSFYGTGRMALPIPTVGTCALINKKPIMLIC